MLMMLVLRFAKSQSMGGTATAAVGLGSRTEALKRNPADADDAGAAVR